MDCLAELLAIEPRRPDRDGGGIGGLSVQDSGKETPEEIVDVPFGDTVIGCLDVAPCMDITHAADDCGSNKDCGRVG